jgi:hypothetical protein
MAAGISGLGAAVPPPNAIPAPGPSPEEQNPDGEHISDMQDHAQRNRGNSAISFPDRKVTDGMPLLRPDEQLSTAMLES